MKYYVIPVTIPDPEDQSTWGTALPLEVRGPFSSLADRDSSALNLRAAHFWDNAGILLATVDDSGGLKVEPFFLEEEKKKDELEKAKELAEADD